MLKDYKLSILSLAVIVLAIVNLIQNQTRTINVNIYLNGDNATKATVVDLSLDYDANSMELASYSKTGVLKSWDNNRFLLIPNSAKLDSPLLTLKFTTNNLISADKIKVSPISQAYLSQIGPVNIPSSGLNYKLDVFK